MQLPLELQFAIDQIVQQSPSFQKGRAALTKDYREGKSSAFGNEEKRLAYLGARMPATYAAAYKVLEQLPFPIEELLDLGAGPGTASWAAANALSSLKKITLMEISEEAIALGKRLAAFSSHPALQQAHWLHQPLSAPLPSAQAAIFSYVLNEIADPTPLIEACWKRVNVLIVIEPGTPRGFQLIRKARDQLIRLKAHLIAPCPHALVCPMREGDWCHFSARVERTRLHRYLKEGTLGYEDEKFSYLIAAKQPGPSFAGRVVRSPLKGSGHVQLTLCTDKGLIEEKTVSRRDKEHYRSARHLEWGDLENFIL